MYPDLSYFLNDIFSTPLDNKFSIFKTYGLSLTLAFLVCSILLKRELKRREKLCLIDLIPYLKITSWLENFFIVAISCILGYKMFYIFLNRANFQNNSNEMILSWHGSFIGGMLFLVLSSLVVYYTKDPNEKRNEHFYNLTQGLTVFVAIFCLIGIKTFGILEVDFQNKTFYEIFNESGTNFLGGLTGGLLAGFIFCRIYKVPLHNLLDSVAPILMIGYTIGRLGCHISGDGCWGITNSFVKPSWLIIPDWLWSYSYPHNVVDKGIDISNFEGKYKMILESPVFPTSLYEAIFGIIMFIVLLQLRKKYTQPYVVFMLYVLSMGIERFIIEFIRVNTKYSFLGLNLSQAQYISLLMIVGSGIFFIYKYKYEFYQKQINQ
jgi:phosphatidylglycerol---prolipoprotein diacylglyceryl transferase